MKKIINIYIIAALAVVFSSCGSSRKATEAQSVANLQSKSVTSNKREVQDNIQKVQATAQTAKQNAALKNIARKDSLLKAKAKADSIKLKECAPYLSSKIHLTLPQNLMGLTLGGKMRMKKDERIQLSLVLPIFGTEMVKVDITPNDMLLIDRHDKMYVQATKEELMQYLPEGSNFSQIEVVLNDASKPGGKSELSGDEIGLKSMRDAKVELYDFSIDQFNMEPTPIPSKYKKMTLADFIKAIKGLK